MKVKSPKRERITFFLFDLLPGDVDWLLKCRLAFWRGHAAAGPAFFGLQLHCLLWLGLLLLLGWAGLLCGAVHHGQLFNLCGHAPITVCKSRMAYYINKYCMYPRFFIVGSTLTPGRSELQTKGRKGQTNEDMRRYIIYTVYIAIPITQQELPWVSIHELSRMESSMVVSSLS